MRSSASSAASPTAASTSLSSIVALAVRVQRQLLDLRPRQRAVGAEPRQQQPLGLRRDLHLGGGEHLADHGFEIARLVGEAGDGGGARPISRTARAAHRRGAGCRLPRSGSPPGRRPRPAASAGQPSRAARPRAHDLAAAEHRRGLQLDEDAGGVVLEAGSSRRRISPGGRRARPGAWRAAPPARHQPRRCRRTARPAARDRARSGRRWPGAP